MLVGGVVRHEVEDQLEAARVRVGEQRVEIGQRAEQRIDVAIIGDVVAEIGHRRGIDRRDPDRVDAEPDQMVEAAANAAQVADAVAVAVLERARIDLIDDARLPPHVIVPCLRSSRRPGHAFVERIRSVPYDDQRPLVQERHHLLPVGRDLSWTPTATASATSRADRRLDYLQGLGVTAIWLMPFQPSPRRDDGYDIADYYGVDPRYGTLGDFVEFTHGCKQRGMRVLIDLVVNHTSDQHPWFQEARSDPTSKYRDWYVWSKKKPADADEGIVFPRRAEIDVDVRQGRRRILFPPLLRFPAGPQHRQPARAGRDPEDHGVLAAARRVRLPHGRGAVRHRREGRRTSAKPDEQYDMLRTLPRVPAMAGGRGDHPGRGQRAAGHRHGIFRRRAASGCR